jgi:hypothetical protein
VGTAAQSLVWPQKMEHNEIASCSASNPEVILVREKSALIEMFLSTRIGTDKRPRF